MKKINLILSLVLVGAFLSSGSIFAEEKDSEYSVGEFVKDSAITTQIKAKVLAAKEIDSLHIKVDTDNSGIVVLTGAVKSAAEKERVHDIAHSVDGVRKVINKLNIDPDLFK